MMNEQDEKLQDMMSEIEVLESEMMEVLSGLHNLSGKRLEKARLTLAEICAEYEIQVADLEIELNVKTLLPDRETLRANCFARAKRIKLFVCASAPITEQLRLM